MAWIITAIPEPISFRETTDWIGMECFSRICRSDRNGSLRKDVWDAFIELERRIKLNMPRLMNDLKFEKQFEEQWMKRPGNSKSWCFFNPYLGGVLLLRVDER